MFSRALPGPHLWRNTGKAKDGHHSRVLSLVWFGWRGVPAAWWEIGDCKAVTLRGAGAGGCPRWVQLLGRAGSRGWSRAGSRGWSRGWSRGSLCVKAALRVMPVLAT